MTNGKVNIHGKEYSTVAYRIHQFRSDHPDWQIHTEVVELDADHVVMRCDICDAAGVHQATGHALETRNASKMHQTSYVEIAETSAVGRALGFLDYGSQEMQIASADEVIAAISSQSDPRVEKMTKAVNACGSLEDLKVVWGAMNEADRKVMQTIFSKRKEEVCKTTTAQT
jgi:hypothetical protein